MDETLQTILLRLLSAQSASAEALAQIGVEFHALRLTLFALDPQAEGIFQEILPGAKEALAEELKRQQAVLAMLKETVSTAIQ
jgi:hypothetical protein